MKTFAFIIMFLCASMAAAQDCGEPDARHWRTTLKLNPTKVTLHWTGVYEGRDSVCGITFKTNSGKFITLDVLGQPVVAREQNLIGFVSCADDGCEKEIHVADIARGVVLKAELPIVVSQFYFKAKWKTLSRELFVEVEPPSNVKALHFLCSVTNNVQCVSVL